MSKRSIDAVDQHVKQLTKRYHRLGKLQRRLSRLNCGTDDITKLPKKWVFRMVLRLMNVGGISALCALAVCSKAWFLLFSHSDFAFWTNLIERNGKDKKTIKFAFANISLKPTFSTHFYLSRWGASYCGVCAMHSGTQDSDIIPISVYAEDEETQRYLCINPACKAPLDQRVGNVQLPELFSQCVKSSRKQQKEHTWKLLQRDLRYPDDSPVHEEYNYCKRCGLLKLEETYNDSDYCDGCCHRKENCDCEPCPRCAKLPLECNCTLCNECGRCEGCDNCTEAKKRLCQCVFCEGCDLLASKCECVD